ncbi:Phytosulfokine [Artemisia annua]|uniref:Phytosulfokine n=1 Tax=Artemisia annua TaxID=35608 RepID=A0A2U1N0D7_ARTAN|nr:Phytosulfokine [Artemisia annua]
MIWRSGTGNDGAFSVKQTYCDLSVEEETVKWSKLVWFSQNIPKHVFIMWLAIQNKLITQVKIRNWGSYDMMCVIMDWNDLVNWCTRLYNSNSIGSVVRRIGLAASVYYILQEMIWRMFKGVHRSIDELFSQLCETVKVRLLSLKVKPSNVFLKVQNEWNITLDIIGKYSFAKTDVKGCLDQEV